MSPLVGYSCCPMDTDGDGNCAIHESPGVYRPFYRNCPNDTVARKVWKELNWLRNYSNTGRRFVNTVLREAPNFAVQKVRAQQMLHDFHQAYNMCTPREPYGLPMGTANTTERAYTLDQLWPYQGFAKPIHELATPHLRNISEQFKDENKYYVNSKNHTRTLEETASLKRRVKLVREVLAEREARDSTSKRDDLQRRVRDAKIRMAQINDRRFQMYNEPDLSELHAMTNFALELIIDLQHELGL